MLVLFGFAVEAAVLMVNTTNNVGPGPTETNLVMALSRLQDGDTILFKIPGTGPFYLKTPTNGYPLITNNNVTIDGYSQPGSAPNTNTILGPNNGRIQIVLDSSDGPEHEERTRLGPLTGTGYADSDSAILAVLGAKNFVIRGVSFLSRHTSGTGPDPASSDPGDPEIYCIALINDATNARIGGCWFGLDPNGASVAGGRSAVAAFKSDSGASASGLIFGTDGNGQSDPAEFNICVGMGLAVNLAAPNVKVAGNFFNVFPNGTRFLDVSTITLLDGGGIEAIDNCAADHIVIGTDHDGAGDLHERSVIGPAFSDTVTRFSGAATNITFAGNYVGVGIDGQTSVTNTATLINIGKLSSIRIGSNFDGTSDPLEGNLICNLDSSFIGFHDNNNDNDGADAARIVVRGNVLVNNSSAILMRDDQNVTIAAYYSSVLADSTNDTTTLLSTNAAGTQLLVAIPPPNTNNYPTAIVDFYAVDPVALSNNFVEGKTYLGSVIDGSADDLDAAPNRVAFEIGNLNLISATTVAALVIYSQDPGFVTRPGRAVTALFSRPVTVSPVAAPLRIRSFAYAKGILTFNVSGGTPPYRLQVRNDLATNSWADLGDAFTNSPITLPADNASQSFYRVKGQ